MRSFITLAVLYAAFVAATPLPQISLAPSLRDLTSIVDGILAVPLDRRQLGGVPDAVSPLVQKVGETVAGSGLTPTRTTVDQAVDSTIGDAALGRRQAGDIAQEVDAVLDGIVILPSMFPEGLDIRQRRGGTGLLADDYPLVDYDLDDANLDALRFRSPGDLALRQLLDVGVVANVLKNLDVNVLDRRQPTVRPPEKLSEILDQVLADAPNLEGGF